MDSVLWVVEQKCGERWSPVFHLTPYNSRCCAIEAMSQWKNPCLRLPETRLAKYVREGNGNYHVWVVEEDICGDRFGIMLTQTRAEAREAAKSLRSQPGGFADYHAVKYAREEGE